jgi:hypothetical protein
MKVNFWGVKSSGCENSQTTEVTFLRKAKFHTEKEAK